MTLYCLVIYDTHNSSGGFYSAIGFCLFVIYDSLSITPRPRVNENQSIGNKIVTALERTFGNSIYILTAGAHRYGSSQYLDVLATVIALVSLVNM